MVKFTRVFSWGWGTGSVGRRGKRLLGEVDKPWVRGNQPGSVGDVQGSRVVRVP